MKKTTKTTTRPKVKAKGPRRTVLVILSNRLDAFAKRRFLEIVCEPDGTILSEKAIRAEPRKAVYDEVWENDEAKTSLDTCTRMKRRYRHPLVRSVA